MTLQHLRKLPSEDSVAEHFALLVTDFLIRHPAQKNGKYTELEWIIELCNHHRLTLWTVYRDQHAASHPFLKTWLTEIASPPSGEWADLRSSLNPFIRVFGLLPRRRGGQLFSPLDRDRSGTELDTAGHSRENEETAVQDGLPRDFHAAPGSLVLTGEDGVSWRYSQEGIFRNPTYSMTGDFKPQIEHC